MEATRASVALRGAPAHVQATTYPSSRAPRCASKTTHLGRASVRHRGSRGRLALAASATVGRGTETVNLDAIRKAIGAIAVGKNGSKPMPEEVVPAVTAALDALEVVRGEEEDGDDTAVLLKAALLGSLFMKLELHPFETPMLARYAGLAHAVQEQGRTRGDGTCSAADLVAAACPSVTPGTRAHALVIQLLNYEYLTTEQTRELFAILFQPGAARDFQALVAPVMRVRHEDSAELLGMALAMNATVPASFSPTSTPPPPGAPVAHVAEPFDGVKRSVMLTPLIAAHLQTKWGLRVATHMSCSAGPKYGPNTKDLVRLLGADDAVVVTSNAQLSATPAFGYYVDQELASPALRDWQSVRRVVMKRPGLATVEKFLDTAGASLFISSAFHPPYTEKMADVAEGLKMPAAVVVRRGLEGSLAFPVSGKRTAEMLCSVQVADGSYVRKTFTFGVADIGEEAEEAAEGGIESDGAGVFTQGDEAAAEAMAGLIRSHHTTGSSGDAVFDKRVRVTLAGLDTALEWIASQSDVLSRNSRN